MVVLTGVSALVIIVLIARRGAGLHFSMHAVMSVWRWPGCCSVIQESLVYMFDFFSRALQNYGRFLAVQLCKLDSTRRPVSHSGRD